MTILATGQSAAGRMQRQVMQGLNNLPRKKAKVTSMIIDTLYKEFRGSS